tara:strand:- start:103 stop:534 length:432 start_codon:yes stop_codon:yes gene_type:complete
MALSNNIITQYKNPIKVNGLMLSIFVISNRIIMKVIQYTKQIIKKSILLFYSTCTNDLIIYSKQASNIELFILAFFIECNRLFIADSIAMNALQKYYYSRVQAYNAIKAAIMLFDIKTKNAALETFYPTKGFNNMYQEERIVN